MKDSLTLAHIGIVVRDIDKAIKFYESLGAVLESKPVIHPFGDLKEWKIYGKTPAKLKFKGCNLKLGSLIIELHQPVEGDSTFQEYLNKNGEGVDHIAFNVDNVKQKTAEMTAKGFPVVQSVIQPGDKCVGVYIDSRKVGNVMIEFNDKSLEDEILEKIKAGES